LRHDEIVVVACKNCDKLIALTRLLYLGHCSKLSHVDELS